MHNLADFDTLKIDASSKVLAKASVVAWTA